MRTKTLLITAALTAVGALSSMAQVYSVNIVGYINLSIPSGFALIGNQLNNSPDNTLNTLLPPVTGPQPSLTAVYKFNGLSFDSELYDAGLGAWSGPGPSGPGTTTLNPGEGVFIFAPTAFTATFVGEVKLSSTVSIPAGAFSIVSSVIPQAGPIYDPTGGPDLGFGVPEQLEVVYQYPPGGPYNSAYWDNNTVPPSWNGTGFSTLAGPQLAVGEAFFNFTPATGNVHSWTRTFSVGP